MGGAPVVDVKGLWTVYGDLVVHRDLDFSVMPGEVVSLVGGSGSGKTTLLRQMLGLERPHRGSIRVFGVPLHSCDPQLFKRIRKRWGVLFQHGALYSALSVFDNIALPLRELTRLPPQVISEMVRIRLALVGLPGMAHRMPTEMSGGQRKRAALARASILDPELMFCDEPSAGLDPVVAAGIDETLLKFRTALGVTLAVVTLSLLFFALRS
jgi:phospholipid/cholesterol/gamma-HCH transport system ATP-binding protein